MYHLSHIGLPYRTILYHLSYIGLPYRTILIIYHILACRTGPTIAEDKELLETTQNSILSVLREEKKKGPIDSDVLGNQIDDIKRQLLILRKQKYVDKKTVKTHQDNN